MAAERVPTTSHRYEADTDAKKTNGTILMPTLIAAKTGRERVAPEPAPFRHVESALRFAYRIEGSAIVKISSLFEQMRGSTVRGESRSDGPWDDHAEAAMILALVERTLAPAKFVCVRARYTMPNDPALDQRKQMDYRILAEIVREGQPEIPHWYAVDCAREWARDRRHHTDAWWARHLKINTVELTRYHFGRKERSKLGTAPFLAALLAAAESDLFVPMLDAGLIEDV